MTFQNPHGDLFLWDERGRLLQIVGDGITQIHHYGEDGHLLGTTVCEAGRPRRFGAYRPPVPGGPCVATYSFDRPFGPPK
jgi:hypothetical protein